MIIFQYYCYNIFSWKITHRQVVNKIVTPLGATSSNPAQLLAGFVLGSYMFNSLVLIVNSQMVCFQLAGICTCYAIFCYLFLI